MSARKTPPVKRLHGILIKPNGEVSPIEVGNTLQALWDIVGGYVERVRLRDGVDLFVSAEGHLLDLPRNRLATVFAEGYQIHPKPIVIVGDALVLGEVTPTGESTDVPDWVHEYLVR